MDHNVDIKEEFDVKLEDCSTDFMMSNEWASTELLHSLFSDDLLEGFDHNSTINENFLGFDDPSRDLFPVSSSSPPYHTNDPSLSSSASDSGLSSDNLDMDLSPDFEPLSPALSSPGPSISERGGQNSPPRCATTGPMNTNSLSLPQQNGPTKPSTVNTKITGQAVKMGMMHKVEIKPEPVSPPSSPPKVIVEKIQPLESTGLIFNKEIGQFQLQTTNAGHQPKELKIYKMTPTSLNYANSNNKKVTIQLKNSNLRPNTNGTVVLNKNGMNLSGVRKLVRVQNPSNPRSILLPVSLQDVKNLRNIKIINGPNNMKSNCNSPNIKLAAANLLQQTKQGLVQKNVVMSAEQLLDDSMSEQSSDAESYIDDTMQTNSGSSSPSKSSSSGKYTQRHNADGTQPPYPKLQLTNEEKRLLSKESITLPSHYPLTKHEERELKRIRRKIRNKISAQDSRKRKKEYVDGLEERVKKCTQENQTLLKRIKILQTQNQSLASQMKKLQILLSKVGNNKTAQPATCLMVLLLSLALVALPNLKLGQSPQETELADVVQDTLLQNRRNLLFDTKEKNIDDTLDEEMTLDAFLAFGEEHTFAGDVVIEPQHKKMRASNPAALVDFDVDDKVWTGPSNNESNKEFIEMAKLYQENLKKSHSSGYNIEDGMQQLQENLLMHTGELDVKSNQLYEINLDKISDISVGGGVVDGVGHIATTDYDLLHERILLSSENQEKNMNSSSEEKFRMQLV